jgi:hypothetical protein
VLGRFATFPPSSPGADDNAAVEINKGNSSQDLVYLEAAAP